MSLDHLIPLENYVPTILRDVREIQELVKSEDYLFDILVSVVNTEYARMFIQTSDEIGVERFERVLEITADPSIETLEFRKERLLTRCNSTLPYTTIWLRMYLNAVLGEYNYQLDIDYLNSVIKLYGYLLNYSWAREASIIIRDIKPCNMIFINIPTIIENLGIQYWWDDNTWNSDIWDDTNIWNDYKVLTSEEIVHYTRETEGSNIETLLNQISAVRLNRTAVIDSLTPYIKDGVIIVNFNVIEDIKLLEHIEILDKQGGKLFATECYIDTPSGTQIEIRLSCYSKENP